MFAHLSALLGLLVGGLTFIGPLIVWLIKKDQSKFVDAHGKEALNFQLNILVYYLISIPIGIFTCAVGVALTVYWQPGVATELARIFTCGVGFVLTAAVIVYGIVMPIIAGLKANYGEYYQYPLTIRVIK
jgi:uncharacterized Tic20 family protein